MNAKMDIGIGEKQRAQVAEALRRLLADTYVLAVKTHGFHWNVVGPTFAMLHELFGEQYEEMFEAADEIAERIRALGVVAPGSFAQFLKAASIAEQGRAPAAAAMVKELLKDNETVSRTARAAMAAAQKAGDEATADLAIERMAAHEKAAWMLRSTLE